MSQSEFYSRFSSVVARHSGIILELPYEIPRGWVAYRIFFNEELMGVATFPTSSQWAMAIDELRDERTDRSSVLTIRCSML
ncbi:MAG: hypothetical protein KDD53_09560 [Bdellovibrionales bacterium]|nr:hypothetical protein [Bdellovibrionales bacterium]